MKDKVNPGTYIFGGNFITELFISRSVTGCFFTVTPHLYSTEKENELRSTIALVQF